MFYTILLRKARAVSPAFDVIQQACEELGFDFSPSVAMRYRLGVAPEGWSLEQFQLLKNQITVTQQLSQD